MAKTFFSEIENLVAILPARQKGVFAFEVKTTHTPGTLPVVTKGLTAYATTLKAAVKEAGKYIETLKKAYEPVSIDLYFYMNGVCIGIMTLVKGRQAVRCDFSGWAMSRATEPATDDTPTETVKEETKSVNDIMDQANRLMSECNAKRNFKRADMIRKIAFRYFDNIRACAGSFDSNDDAEYNKQYSRDQYMSKPAKPQYLKTSDTWNTDYFMIVDEFPAGAVVWNIGRHNFPFPGFIPVAWPLDDCHIDRTRLMAVRCKDDETADAILKAAGRREVNSKRFALLNA